MQHSNNFPDKPRVQYTTFLDNALRQVQQEKITLAAAMSARLQLMRKTGSITNEDVTLDLITHVNKVKTFKPETIAEFKRLPMPFDSQIFKKMFQYVAEQGGTMQLQRTFNLQQSDKTILLVGKQCTTQYIFLPANLSKYVPEKPSRFGFLFKGYRFRYEFFKDKTALLLKMAFLADLKVKANCYHYPAEDEFWQQLKETENLIDSAI